MSATSRKGQPDPNLQAVQNPEHPQQQAGRASQILTYTLFKTQSMILSATSRKGQPDAELHSVPNQALSVTSMKGQPEADLLSVQNQEYTVVRNKQEGPATG